MLSDVAPCMNGGDNNNDLEPIGKTSAAGRKGYDEFGRPSGRSRERHPRHEQRGSVSGALDARF